MGEYSIAKNFNQFFQIKFADTKLLREEAFKIRYGVYCDELGWEPENLLQMETDDCDDYAYHCLLEHKRTGVYAGCVRLVIPPVKKPDLALPFEKNCLHSAHKEILDSTKLIRGSFGEISRLAVLNSFRRRKKEKKAPFILNAVNSDTIYTEEEHRHFPNIAMGLYIAAVALADICNHVGSFVMMEPKLNRRLRRFGLPFEQIGDEIDYHGMRAMFFLSRYNFCSQLNPELKELYAQIYDDLVKQVFLLPHTDVTNR
ncbi:PEP-CTERM/exosortase system-associated acyltransferase [Colwellia psychrerythraea]|uniref:Putative PEP-CTERM/exosortase system-associated acyltransferase n=1 Tax=Colwellia psychrerythraea TaxID=28229 RepID=A0A099KDS5_COLPS|nr:PEP-CTERM/exosortase system-associated acyltransferase [Colwellia psychrerythraea]KGJ88470.1 putative PEP-CTERM/exosortase system-associated acyltransferase [Colwellia psychrerythraea]